MGGIMVFGCIRPQHPNVTGMPFRATVDGSFSHDPVFADAAVDRDMRRHLASSQVADESPHVVSLVGGQRDTVASLMSVDHRERRFAFGRAGGVIEHRVHSQPIAILYQYMTHEAQPARRPCSGLRTSGKAAYS